MPGEKSHQNVSTDLTCNSYCKFKMPMTLKNLYVPVNNINVCL